MISIKEQFRSKIIFFLLLLGMIGLLIRLFDLQCCRYEKYIKRAWAQQQSRESVHGRRGRIFDCNGNLFANSSGKPAVWSDPMLIKNHEKTELKLAKILRMPVKDVKNKLFNPNRPGNRFVWIKKEISDEQAIRIRILIKQKQLPGIFIKDLQQRIYPKGKMLGNIIGLCNAAGKGVEGLEHKADIFLAGTAGYRFTGRDNKRRRFFAPEWISKQLEPEDGYDLHLTINQYIQHIADEELAKAVRKFKPVHAMAMVMDLSKEKKGEVMAIALWPSFNPNETKLYKPGIIKNYTVTDVFEPGSIMKVISGAIAINENVADLNTKVFCENGIWNELVGKPLNDDHPLGNATFKDVIKYSSNIGIAKIAGKVDRKTFYQYLKKFGFGEKTGVNFVASESKGILRAPSEWTERSMISLPMGQEIGVTALQMLNAVSTIANKGERVKPYIIKKIDNSNGILHPESHKYNYFEKNVLKKDVVKPKTAEMIVEAMISVTQGDGTGSKAAIEGYTVAGKTGTAQKYINGAYSKKDYIASFVGFVPAKNPAFSVIVVIDSPRGNIYGGTVAAPVFKNICKETLAYLKIKKD